MSTSHTPSSFVSASLGELQVALESFQTFLINTLRRWHVVTISFAIPAFVLVAPRTIDSTIGRQKAANNVFIIIIALGELIELAIIAFTPGKRSRLQNVQRIACYLIKVPVFVLINEFLLEKIIKGIPMLSTPWEP